MKARPRCVERSVAEALSSILNTPVERIPVLGRTGPDLTYHPPLNLIVDVKSRINVPVSISLCTRMHRARTCSFAPEKPTSSLRKL